MIFGNPVHGTIHPLSWQRPSGSLDFKITQPFGCTGVIYEPPLGSCAHYHRGIDVANGHCGADVLAVKAGRVHFAGTLNDGAKAVIIDHGSGWFSNVGHLSVVSVSAGQQVSQGQKVGEVGSSGNSTACHVHFAIKSNMNGDRSFFNDDNGHWVNAWPLLAQNVTVHPKGAEVNIRNTAGGEIYALTEGDGRIHRSSDGSDRGATAASRKWGGIVTGPSYTVAAGTSNRWEKIWLDGAYRFVASLLAVRSAS